MKARTTAIRLALDDLKRAQTRLRLAGCPYARLAVARARRSVEGAQRHAQRGRPASSRIVRRQRKIKTRAEQIVDRIYDVLWDDADHNWRELNSCADAVQDICLVLGSKA